MGDYARELGRRYEGDPLSLEHSPFRHLHHFPTKPTVQSGGALGDWLSVFLWASVEISSCHVGMTGLKGWGYA